MSRHPYTYAADFIRGLGPVGPGGVVLSRSDASQIRQGIAKALGIDDEELANALSIAFQSRTHEEIEFQTRRFIEALRP